MGPRGAEPRREVEMCRVEIVFVLVITACGSSPPPEAESRPTPEPESAQVDDPGDELACVRDDQCVASTLRCCECPLCPHAAVARTVSAERRLTEECRTDDCVTPRADECPPCPPDEARLAVCRDGACVLAE